MHRAKYFIVAALAILILSAGTAQAVTIRENQLGTQTSLLGYWGQSVVTGAGGPWNNIQFNFFSAPDTPLAFGNIFLLTSEYLGAPNALSAATVGFVAQAAASGGLYSFASGVTLASNTQYFFYTDGQAASVLTGNTPSGVPGENHYYSSDAGSNFSGPFNGVNFRVTGNAQATPEPSSLILVGIGLVAMALSRRK